MIFVKIKRHEIPMILGWIKEIEKINMNKENFPWHTTYVVKANNEIMASVTIILTNIKVLWVENLISNPNTNKIKRGKAVEFLIKNIDGFAKLIGAEKIFCLAPNKILSRFYRKFGYQKTLVNSVFPMVKGV